VKPDSLKFGIPFLQSFQDGGKFVLFGSNLFRVGPSANQVSDQPSETSCLRCGLGLASHAFTQRYRRTSHMTFFAAFVGHQGVELIAMKQPRLEVSNAAVFTAARVHESRALARV
jgi:hypothetical protein